MSDLMHNCIQDNIFDVLVRGGCAFDGLLINDDTVGKRIPVIPFSFREGHPLVETEKRARCYPYVVQESL